MNLKQILRQGSVDPTYQEAQDMAEKLLPQPGDLVAMHEYRGLSLGIAFVVADGEVLKHEPLSFVLNFFSLYIYVKMPNGTFDSVFLGDIIDGKYQRTVDDLIHSKDIDEHEKRRLLGIRSYPSTLIHATGRCVKLPDSYLTPEQLEKVNRFRQHFNLKR